MGVYIQRLNFVYYIENQGEWWTWYDRKEKTMDNRNVNFGTEKELQEAVLQEKLRGTPDSEIWG